MTERITTPVLAALAGITYRRADYWARTGLLYSNNPSPGHGHPRTHPVTEVEVAERVGRLMNAGFGDADVAFRIARGWVTDAVVLLADHGIALIDTLEASP